MEIQVITNRCFGLFMRRNVSISRNRNKIERLLDWKKFPSKSVGRFSFQCLTVKARVEAFARVLFSSFVKMKSSQYGEITLSFTDIGKSCPSRQFLALQICLLTLFVKIKFSGKFPDLQYAVYHHRETIISN